MKINATLTITLSIITISLFLLAVLYVESTRRDIENVMNIQKTHALQAQKSIEEFFHYYQHSLEFFAGHREIKSFSGQSANLLEEYYKKHGSDISGVTLINRYGIITNTAPFNQKAIGADISQQRHNYGKILSPEVILSDVFETAQGFKAISMSVPVYSGNKINGRLSLLFNFKSIAERYISDICRDNPGKALLLSRDGTILFHNDPELIGHNANELHTESLKMKGIFENMSSGMSNTVHFKLLQNGRNIEHYGFYIPLNILNNYWSVFIITPAPEIKKISRPFRFMFAAITLMILAAGVFFGVNLIKYIRILELKKDELARSNRQLSLSMEQIKQLNQLLPICSNCKKIRNDSGYWQQIETYISDNSETAFTHSLCPDCAKKLYPDHNPEKGKA